MNYLTLTLTYVDLVEFDLPYFRLFSDGRLLDMSINEERIPQKNGMIETVSKITNERVRFPFDRAIGYYFRAPWRQLIVPKWKCMHCLGYSRYAIVENGSVFSTHTWDYLVGAVTPDGYDQVYMIPDIGKPGQSESVHRLVALSFIPNLENKPEVNHIDGNKHNNYISNLEWVYSWENMEHALNNGLRYRAISDETIHTICKMLADGVREYEIAIQLNISKHHIVSIKSGVHNRISKYYNIPRIKHF